MKKQFIYLLLLWVTFNGFSQKLSVSTQNTVDTKYQQIERITNFSPSYFMQSPQRLLEYWGDEVLDVKLYSEKERSFQERINETLAKKFVLAHAESHDEDFPNDNYQLPLEQRLIDNEPITPYTWKWVSFEIRQESGRTESVKLCRPNWFLKKLGATAIGRTVYLSIPETGIDGYAIVTKISPCQLDTRLLSPNSKSEYVYRPITGQFQHQQAEVWDFEFSDGSTIGATSNHPFFSLERGAYVAVGELKLGETVKNSREKTLKLTSKTLRPQTETVYNLEVYRDHTYLVGDDGVLVHNACYGTITKQLTGNNIFLNWVSGLNRYIQPSLLKPPYPAWGDYQRRICGTVEEYRIPLPNGGNILADGIDAVEQALIDAKFIGSLANTPYHIRSLQMLDKPWIANVVENTDKEFERYAQAIASGSTSVRQLIVKTNVSDPNVEAFFAHFFQKYNIPGRVDIVP